MELEIKTKVCETLNNNENSVKNIKTLMYLKAEANKKL